MRLDQKVDENIIEIPIDGTLDLHTFHPREVKHLVTDYIEECLKKGIFNIRIIHGKGTGTLKKVVHSVLNGHPDVISYKIAGEDGGSWGATLVSLKK